MISSKKLRVMIYSNNPYSEVKVLSSGFVVTEECEPLEDSIRRMHTRTGWKEGLHYHHIEVKDSDTNEMLQIHDVILSLGDKEIKTVRTVLDPNDLDYQNLKKNVYTWYKYVYGQDYDTITTELINTIENGTVTHEKMAKKKSPGLYHIYVDRSGLPEAPVSFHWEFDDEPTLEEVEEKILSEDIGYERDYCKVEINLIHPKQMAKKATTVTAEEIQETGLVAVDTIETKIALPTITKEFTLGGVKFSPDLIEAEVKKVLEMKLESPQDKAGYEKIKKEAAKLQKTRTSSKTARENASKPVNAWLKSFKKTVEDDIAAAVAPGEAHCKAQMKLYEDWEEEQRLAEEKAILARVSARSQQLSELQGVKNFESEHWTFPYDPTIIIEKDSLEAEFGWDEEYAIVEASFKTYQQKKKDEDAKAGQIVQALVNSRIMLLEMMGYTEGNGNYLKNGYVITPDQIKDTPDADWKALIQSHNMTAQAANPFEPATSPVAEAVPDPVAPNPFAQAFPTAGEGDVSAQVTETTNNPFAQFALTAVSEESQNVAEAPLVLTPWDEDTKFVEQKLKGTTLRVFPVQFKEESISIPDRDNRIGFQGELGNGLWFIIYAN